MFETIKEYFGAENTLVNPNSVGLIFENEMIYPGLPPDPANLDAMQLYATVMSQLVEIEAFTEEVSN